MTYLSRRLDCLNLIQEGHLEWCLDQQKAPSSQFNWIHKLQSYNISTKHSEIFRRSAPSSWPSLFSGLIASQNSFRVFTTPLILSPLSPPAKPPSMHLKYKLTMARLIFSIWQSNEQERICSLKKISAIVKVPYVYNSLKTCWHFL